MSKKNQTGITLPHEVADGIAVATLKQFHRYLLEECTDCMRKIRKPESVKHKELHRQNLANAQSMLIHFEEVLAYFGERPEPAKRSKP